MSRRDRRRKAAEDRRYVKIGNTKVGIVSPEEAELVSTYVCMRKASDPGTFSDNLEAPCALCGETVIYRPYGPVKPMKVCVECALAMAEAVRH